MQTEGKAFPPRNDSTRKGDATRVIPRQEGERFIGVPPNMERNGIVSVDEEEVGPEDLEGNDVSVCVVESNLLKPLLPPSFDRHLLPCPQEEAPLPAVLDHRQSRDRSKSNLLIVVKDELFAARRLPVPVIVHLVLALLIVAFLLVSLALLPLFVLFPLLPFFLLLLHLLHIIVADVKEVDFTLGSRFLPVVVHDARSNRNKRFSWGLEVHPSLSCRSDHLWLILRQCHLLDTVRPDPLVEGKLLDDLPVLPRVHEPNLAPHSYCGWAPSQGWVNLKKVRVSDDLDPLVELVLVSPKVVVDFLLKVHPGLLEPCLVPLCTG
mmetsp:Transcript_19404/g.40502  ORF Transcript_19404/g.40502 Transcript_19404/m.40502 type:complete len:321 (-) Transcript_19404:2648-3610(-)